MRSFEAQLRITEGAFEQQRRTDSFGHKLHAMLGAAWCFFACGPMSMVELGLIPVVLCFAIRLPRHWRVDGRLIHQTAAQIGAAFIAWQFLSTSWSANRTLGLDEAVACRFALSLVLLWPVLDRRSWLIAGLGTGMLAANLAQVSHALGSALDVEWLRFPRAPHRNSGWWQPVVGGSMLTAALGLHLPALLTGSLRARVVGVGGCAASGAGVLATGSRGAWIASVMLIVIAAGWSVWRARAAPVGEPKGSQNTPRGGVRAGHLPLIGAVVFLVGVVGHQTLWPSLRARGEAGVAEVRRAIEARDYSSDTGARVLMAEMAVRATIASPIKGVGAGGYRVWGREWLNERERDADADRLHNHAHNTVLHLSATTGLIGTGAFVWFVVLAIRGGLKRRRGEVVRGYAAGPAFALVGFVMVFPFDVIPVNAQTSAVMWILVTLCLRGRPTEAGTPGVTA